MSSRPWMPLYIGDYLGATGHLNTIQHGAYFLLIMHYWRKGGLPTDDAHLARITRLPVTFWIEKVRPDIEPLFLEGWRHDRIDKELAKQEVIATKRAIAGRKGGDATATRRFAMANFHVNGQAIAKQLPPKTEQLPSKRVAVTVTEESKKEAADKATGKDVARMTKTEFEEHLQAKRAS